MKNSISTAKYLAALTLIIALAFAACKKDRNPVNLISDERLSVNELRTFSGGLFEDDRQKGSRFNENRLTAQWSAAYSIKLKTGGNLIHVPLADIYEDYNGSKTHLVAYKDSTNKIEAAIMVIHPASGNTKDISRFTTLKGFNGDVLLYNLNKKFMRGYALIDGKIAGEAKTEENRFTQSRVNGRISSLPNKTSGWEEKCEWRQGQNYVNSNGEVVVVSRRFCSWHYNQPDGFLPEEQTIDFIEAEPSYGGEIVTEEEEKKIISKDTSITNNLKAKCALEKLLNNNVKFDSLLKAFTGNEYNLTFKVKSMGNVDTPRGHTTYDPLHPENFIIALNRKFVEGAPPIHIAKTLLHEAFHANLMQRAYQVFGGADINANWAKKPEELTLNELIDIFESKLSGSNLLVVHHEYIAKHINILVDGLKEFASKYDSSFSSYTDYQYLGVVWEGLDHTTYYKNEVKNTRVYYVPGTDINANADTLYRNQRSQILNSSNVNCND